MFLFLYFRYENNGVVNEEDLQQSQIIKSTFSDEQNNNSGIELNQSRKGQLTLPLNAEYWPTEGN